MGVSPTEYRASLSCVSDNSILSPVAKRVLWLEEIIPALMAKLEASEDPETLVLYHTAEVAMEWPNSDRPLFSKPNTPTT